MRNTSHASQFSASSIPLVSACVIPEHHLSLLRGCTAASVVGWTHRNRPDSMLYRAAACVWWPSCWTDDLDCTRTSLARRQPGSTEASTQPAQSEACDGPRHVQARHAAPEPHADPPRPTTAARPAVRRPGECVRGAVWPPAVYIGSASFLLGGGPFLYSTKVLHSDFLSEDLFFPSLKRSLPFSLFILLLLHLRLLDHARRLAYYVSFFIIIIIDRTLLLI